MAESDWLCLSRGQGPGRSVSPGAGWRGAFSSEGQGSLLASRSVPLLAWMWTQLRQKETQGQHLVLLNARALENWRPAFDPHLPAEAGLLCEARAVPHCSLQRWATCPACPTPPCAGGMCCGELALGPGGNWMRVPDFRGCWVSSGAHGPLSSSLARLLPLTAAGILTCQCHSRSHPCGVCCVLAVCCSLRARCPVWAPLPAGPILTNVCQKRHWVSEG